MNQQNPAPPLQNTLAPCPQQWTVESEKDWCFLVMDGKRQQVTELLTGFMKEIADAHNAALATCPKDKDLRRALAINDELWTEEATQWRHDLYVEAHELLKNLIAAAPCPIRDSWTVEKLDGGGEYDGPSQGFVVASNRRLNRDPIGIGHCYKFAAAHNAACPIKDGEEETTFEKQLAQAEDFIRIALGKPEASPATTGKGPMELGVLLDRIEQRANDYRIPKGPWVVDHDSAEECGPHAHSGLAIVLAPQDDSKLPWPPARLLEWPTAKFIAAARSDVPALVKALRQFEEAADFVAHELQRSQPHSICISVLDDTIRAIAQLLSAPSDGGTTDEQKPDLGEQEAKEQR